MQSLTDSTANKRKVLARRLEREGFNSISELPYEKYLRSALWQTIRDWVVDRDGGNCTICEGNATEVHHHDYEEPTMWGEQSDSLTALCSRCHQLIEFDAQNKKRNFLSEKRQVYNDLKALYTQLKSENFQCSIKKTFHKNSTTIHIQYEGRKEYLNFVNLVLEAYSFCISSRKQKEYRDAVKYPMPFCHTKLEQKSGLQIKNRETNKVIAIMKASKSSITLKVYNSHSIPFEDKLLSYLEQNCYVRFAQN